MEDDTPFDARELRILIRQHHPRWITFSVMDRGPGGSNAIAKRLFTPFFTTRDGGMGLGLSLSLSLSLSRTVIEQHGSGHRAGAAKRCRHHRAAAQSEHAAIQARRADRT